MNILALDTSAKAASCAIYKDDVLLAESFCNANLTHSQTIMPMVRDMLASSACSLANVDAFAVSVGPGSFTGLRIGISAVKGMAMATNTPCIAVSTLEALAYNLTCFSGIVVPVMDARREQVYTSIFKSGDAPLRLTDDEAISIAELAEKLKAYTEPIMLVGDGACLCFKAMSATLPNLRIAPENLRHQRAASVCQAARNLAAQNAQALATAESLDPVYLRLPQAERERLEKSLS